jgi:hypothetical protein
MHYLSDKATATYVTKTRETLGLGPNSLFELLRGPDSASGTDGQVFLDGIRFQKTSDQAAPDIGIVNRTGRDSAV